MSTVRYTPNEVARRCDVRPDEQWRAGYGRAWRRHDYVSSHIPPDSDQWVEVRPAPVKTQRITLTSALRDKRKLRAEGDVERWVPLHRAISEDGTIKLWSIADRPLVGPAFDGYVEALLEDS